MSDIKKVNPNPFHPLFAALRDRAMKSEGKDMITSSANRCVALVSYADGLLDEIFEKADKLRSDYKASEEYLKKMYGSVKWFSSDCFGKLYAGLELRALRSTPQDGFINLNELSDGVKHNIMFKDALELLSEAELIELESNHLKARITLEGSKYLRTILENQRTENPKN